MFEFAPYYAPADDFDLLGATAGDEIELGPQCLECGCSNGRPCVTQFGNCFWLSDSPPICSGCGAGTGAVSP